MASKRKKISQTQELSMVHPYAAGIDIGATFHVAAICHKLSKIKPCQVVD
jgi:hypothetical protein